MNISYKLILFMFFILFLSAIEVYSANLDNVFCYPNPFSPFKDLNGVKIQYRLSTDAEISVTIYNLVGDVVYSKVYAKGIDNISKAGQGSYEVEWDGKNNDGRYVADGGYILQIKSNDGSKSVIKYLKILVIKDR